jgi:hypothetical protein
VVLLIKEDVSSARPSEQALKLDEQTPSTTNLLYDTKVCVGSSLIFVPPLPDAASEITFKTFAVGRQPSASAIVKTWVSNGIPISSYNETQCRPGANYTNIKLQRITVQTRITKRAGRQVSDLPLVIALGPKIGDANPEPQV